MIDGINYNSYSEALRKMGQVIIEVSQINTPKLTVSDAELDEKATVNDWVELAQDTDYWVAWTNIQETVREHTPHHEVSYGLFSGSFYTGLYSSVSVELLSGKQRIGLLGIEYIGSGETFIIGEYRHPYTGTWERLYEGIPWVDDIDALTIGRRISSLELSYLAAETGSCAAALDFWQTHPETGWYSQSEWADLRGVNRQTVNDRRRDAREQLKQD